MRTCFVVVIDLTARLALHLGFNMFNDEAGRLALPLWSIEYLEFNIFDGEAGRLALCFSK